MLSDRGRCDERKASSRRIAIAATTRFATLHGRLVNGKWSGAAAGVQRQLEDRGVPRERSGAGRQRQERRDGVVHREAEQGQAYLAFSQDAGATFGAPIRVDDGGSLGRVDVELFPMAPRSRPGSSLRINLSRRSPRARRTRTVPRPPYRSPRHAVGGRHRSRHRRQPGQRLSRAWRSPTARSCLRGPNRRMAAAAGPHRRGTPSLSTGDEARPSRSSPGSRSCWCWSSPGVMLVLQGRGVSARPQPSWIEAQARCSCAAG